MADLRVNYSGWAGYGWEGYFVVGYTTSYDPASNTTTVTLSESVQHRYYGLNGYRTSASLNITVRADDSGDNGTASGSYTSTTNGGTDNFYSYPSPRVITVQHTGKTGAKSVTISASSTLYLWIGASNESATSGSGSVSVQTGTFTSYTLSTSAGTGSTIAVNRTSSNFGGTGGLSNGATIYLHDVLQITFGADPGYKLKTHTVNGSEFASGGTHTVSGNVTIVAVAELQGLVYIHNGTTWGMYQAFIDNGSKWIECIPYVDNGSGWKSAS